MTKKINGRVIADISVLLTLTTISALYLYDSIQASSHIYNLIAVVPLAVIVIGLCLIELIQKFRGNLESADHPEKVKTVVPVIALFIFYVLTLPWLGFDLGTGLFVALFLWVHGERRWTWLIAYSATFAMVTAFFFSGMLPYPMPMTFLATDY